MLKKVLGTGLTGLIVLILFLLGPISFAHPENILTQTNVYALISGYGYNCAHTYGYGYSCHSGGGGGGGNYYYYISNISFPIQPTFPYPVLGEGNGDGGTTNTTNATVVPPVIIVNATGNATGGDGGDGGAGFGASLLNFFRSIWLWFIGLFS
jgi:hypothetical protein